MKFLIVNGVNLNLTGLRERSVYGRASLAEINDEIAAHCAKNGDEAEFYQSNEEGALCGKLHDFTILGEQNVFSMRARIPITATRCATQSPLSISPWRRCTCRISARAKGSEAAAFCRRYAAAWYSASAPQAIWRRWKGSNGRRSREK